MRQSIALLSILIALLAGCAGGRTVDPNLYYWGNYESLVYAMYNGADKVPPEKQLASLEADYQQAQAANKPVPPGYHAHLGLLYYQLGKKAEAVKAFEAEKQLFPEATVYMNRLLARLKS